MKRIDCRLPAAMILSVACGTALAQSPVEGGGAAKNKVGTQSRGLGSQLPQFRFDAKDSLAASNAPIHVLGADEAAVATLAQEGASRRMSCEDWPAPYLGDLPFPSDTHDRLPPSDTYDRIVEETEEEGSFMGKPLRNPITKNHAGFRCVKCGGACRGAPWAPIPQAWIPSMEFRNLCGKTIVSWGRRGA